MLAKSIKKGTLKGQFHKLKNSCGYFAKLKPQGSVYKWLEPHGVIIQFSPKITSETHL